MTELSVVVICVDPARPILDRFLSSLRQYTTVGYELIVVDNAGADRALSAFLQASCDRYIRLEEPLSVAAAWNTGIAAASGEYILVTNDDVVISRNWFEEMREVFVTRERAGMVVPVVNYGRREQTHVGEHSRLHEAGPVRLRPFKELVWGAFMLFTRSSLNRVGNFSEEFAPASGEDLDMCFKLFEAGLDIYVHHRVFIYHEYRATTNRLMGDDERRELYLANYMKFKQKWRRYTSDWDRPPGGGALGRWWTALATRGRQ